MRILPLNIQRFGRIWLAILLCLIATACSDSRDRLQRIMDAGEIRVISRQTPTTYYQHRGEPTGLEHELSSAFAEHLGVKLLMLDTTHREGIYQALHDGEADLAAAGLVAEPDTPRLRFAPSYQTVNQVVVYRRGHNRAKSLEDLIGKRLTVVEGSHHEKALQELQLLHPSLQWNSVHHLDDVDLLQQLEEALIDFSVIDSNLFQLYRGFYPHLRVAFTLKQNEKLAWAILDTEDNFSLYKEMDRFFTTIKKDGRLDIWLERHYGHSQNLSQVHSQTFLRMVDKRLPKYKNLIETIALEGGMDWRLLAAISYQESYWNPKAKSPTGVRGMMMLTQTTAKEVGIKKRTDAEQSLRGGLRYLQKLLARIPNSVNPEDRLWFALAAYNVGMGHIHDARAITEQRGGDPSLWKDVKESLPLLRDPNWYRKTRHGFARGDEPVQYVQNVRHYYALLSKLERQKIKRQAPKLVQSYAPPPFQQRERDQDMSFSAL